MHCYEGSLRKQGHKQIAQFFNRLHLGLTEGFVRIPIAVKQSSYSAIGNRQDDEFADMRQEFPLTLRQSRRFESENISNRHVDVIFDDRMEGSWLELRRDFELAFELVNAFSVAKPHVQ